MEYFAFSSSFLFPIKYFWFRKEQKTKSKNLGGFLYLFIYFSFFSPLTTWGVWNILSNVYAYWVLLGFSQRVAFGVLSLCFHLDIGHISSLWGFRVLPLLTTKTWSSLWTWINFHVPVVLKAFSFIFYVSPLKFVAYEVYWLIWSFVRKILWEKSSNQGNIFQKILRIAKENVSKVCWSHRF